VSLLVLQQGHCYRTTGATGTTGEQQFATAVGDAAYRYIDGRNGWAVRRILADAPAAQYRGDAFAAVHCDGSIHPGARGASIGYATPEGQAFGHAWKAAYSRRGWPSFRTDNYTSALAGYYGTRIARSEGNRAAFILEAGFLTSLDDRALLHAPDGPDRVALALADAMGIKQPTPPAEPDPMEENMIKLMRGDSRVVVPGSETNARPQGLAYGDHVFLVKADPTMEGTVTRSYVPWGNLYHVLVGMLGIPVVISQAAIDSIPWPNAEQEAPAYLKAQ
jgi:hypothetical protein